MQFADLVIGQYYPGRSFLHAVDPRVKIIAAILYVAALFVVTGFTGLALMAAALLVGLIVARIPPLWLLRGLRPVLLLVAVTFILQLFLQGGGEPLGRLGPVTVYSEGARDGAFLAARLALLVLSGSLLAFTTPPVLFADAFGSMLAPLARLRLPVQELVLMMTIALRFIPTLLTDLNRIIKAQMARGAEIGRGGPLKRARNMFPVLIPLFVMSFRHADELAMAMESRCWRGGRGRTVRRRLKFGWRDATFTLAFILLLLIVFLLK